MRQAGEPCGSRGTRGPDRPRESRTGAGRFLAHHSSALRTTISEGAADGGGSPRAAPDPGRTSTPVTSRGCAARRLTAPHPATTLPRPSRSDDGRVGSASPARCGVVVAPRRWRDRDRGATVAPPLSGSHVAGRWVSSAGATCEEHECGAEEDESGGPRHQWRCRRAGGCQVPARRRGRRMSLWSRRFRRCCRSRRWRARRARRSRGRVLLVAADRAGRVDDDGRAGDGAADAVVR